MTMKKALTLAGSDSSGGAGIAADLKTFQEHNVYGMTALTSIVTMNPEGWGHDVTPIDAEVVEKQLNTILSVGVDAMKSGMLGSVDIINLGAKKLMNTILRSMFLTLSWYVKGKMKCFSRKTQTRCVKNYCLVLWL